MQIIFEQNLVPELRKKYVVLELDTIMQPNMVEPLTIYCLIDNIGPNDILNLPNLIEQHEKLIKAYKSNDWTQSKELAYQLKGSWQKEIDEFYDLVIITAEEMTSTNKTWNGVRYTEPKEE